MYKEILTNEWIQRLQYKSNKLNIINVLNFHKVMFVSVVSFILCVCVRNRSVRSELREDSHITQKANMSTIILNLHTTIKTHIAAPCSLYKGNLRKYSQFKVSESFILDSMSIIHTWWIVRDMCKDKGWLQHFS